MVDSALRIRVERLLRKEFRSDDLTRLFLYARDRCDGRESVQEIGDFVAHHDERTKGIVTRSVRDWFHLTCIVASGLAGDGPFFVDWNRLPANTPEYLSTTMRRSSDATLKKQIGISRAQAERTLPKALDALIQNADGTFRAPHVTASPEARLIHCLCTMLIVQPAFTADRLCNDFCATLKSHGLLEKKETRKFIELKTAICFFAISVMHNCAIRIEDGAAIKLSARHDDKRNTVDVLAAVPALNIGQPNQVSLASPIFSAPSNSIDRCHPDLLAMARWNCDLELASDGQLIPLR